MGGLSIAQPVVQARRCVCRQQCHGRRQRTSLPQLRERPPSPPRPCPAACSSPSPSGQGAWPLSQCTGGKRRPEPAPAVWGKGAKGTGGVCSRRVRTCWPLLCRRGRVACRSQRRHAVRGVHGSHGSQHLVLVYPMTIPSSLSQQSPPCTTNLAKHLELAADDVRAHPL